MELVEGDDLSQRLARGAIPVDEALPIARAIADAVEAAHEQGGTWRVYAAGGAASPVTTMSVSRQETGHSTPVFLPDGKHFLYLRESGLPENMGIYLGALDATPEQQASTRLVATGSSPVYARSPDPNIGVIRLAHCNLESW
jgi:hypothetical protein